MAMITSRQEFIDYCLRKLGFPVIEINVDDQQIEDRVDDGFLYWQDYHYDGTERTYYSHQITQIDIDNGYITIPESMLSVIRAFPLSNSMGSIMNDPSLGYSGNMGLYGGLNSGIDGGTSSISDQAGGDSGGALTSYYITMQSMATYESMFNGSSPIRFNRHTNQIHIDMDWSEKAIIGNYILLEGYKTLNPDLYTDVYNDRWLKEYVTSLIKRQWGQNLLKYEGMQLPGGMTFNGRQLYEDGLTEVEKLEEDIQIKYELPPMMIMG